MRLKKDGAPWGAYPKNRKSPPADQRFWAKVDKRGDDECWIWLGHPGMSFLRGDGRFTKAQRHVFETAHRPLAAKEKVRRTCGNTLCVNPAHLYAKLSEERLAKSRARRAERLANPLTFEKRFWSKVDKAAPGGCWEWIGVIGANGYGYINKGRSNNLLAHRVSYEMHKGPIPKGLFVCHECDNRKCVNPKHLTAGSQAYNIAGMVERGRSAKGESHSQVKLTENQVRAIRADPRPQHVIAQDYADVRLTRSAVQAIKNGRTWKHVT